MLLLAHQHVDRVVDVGVAIALEIHVVLDVDVVVLGNGDAVHVVHVPGLADPTRADAAFPIVAY